MRNIKFESQREGVSYRVVAVVAGNSEAVTLSGLRADTQYQLVVTAVRAGKKYRSRPIVFRTLGESSVSFHLFILFSFHLFPLDTPFRIISEVFCPNVDRLLLLAILGTILFLIKSTNAEIHVV